MEKSGNEAILHKHTNRRSSESLDSRQHRQQEPVIANQTASLHFLFRLLNSSCRLKLMDRFKNDFNSQKSIIRKEMGEAKHPFVFFEIAAPNDWMDPFRDLLLVHHQHFFLSRCRVVGLEAATHARIQ
jgi:hypothetical protein